MKNFTIDHTHPSLPGHFPNNPIVPGVVILQNVLNLFSEENPNYVINGVSNVKFIQPMKLTQTCQVDFKTMTAERFSFTLQQHDELITIGTISASRTI